MFRAVAAAIALTVLLSSSAAAAADTYVAASCQGFSVYTHGHARPTPVLIIADRRYVYKDRVSPYLSWSQPWPTVRRYHTVWVRVGREWLSESVSCLRR